MGQLLVAFVAEDLGERRQGLFGGAVEVEKAVDLLVDVRQLGVAKALHVGQSADRVHQIAKAGKVLGIVCNGTTVAPVATKGILDKGCATKLGQQNGLALVEVSLGKSLPVVVQPRATNTASNFAKILCQRCALLRVVM